MQIEYSKQAEKFIRKQDKPTRTKLMEAIEKIPSGEGDITKLTNVKGFRLRVGYFRILYDINGNILDVLRVHNRGQVYKKR